MPQRDSTGRYGGHVTFLVRPLPLSRCGTFFRNGNGCEVIPELESDLSLYRESGGEADIGQLRTETNFP